MATSEVYDEIWRRDKKRDVKRETRCNKEEDGGRRRFDYQDTIPKCVCYFAYCTFARLHTLHLM